MKKEERLIHLQKRAKEEIKLDQDLIILTIISSLLAVFGIKMNNTYILIGSMLVSPLFDPIISTVVFVITNKWKEFWSSLKSLGIVLSISILTSGISWVLFLKLGVIKTLNSLSTSFNMFDVLGVAILIGIVGTLFWIWPKSSNSSAGIAIAISLVPPIANMTLGLAAGDSAVSLNYLYILTLNLLGILLGSIIILKIYVRGRHKNKL